MTEKNSLGAGEKVSYTCRRIGAPIEIDGRLEKDAWAGVSRSPRFGDMATGRLALFDTRAAMQWNDECLYVGFWLEERDVWSTGEERSSLVWQDNTVEVFVAGQGAYCELAVNPLGRTSEMFFIWKDAYQRGGRYDVPEFDLALHRPMVFGGDSGPRHPRGMRWGFFPWRFPGLQMGVQVDGTLDRRDDIDRGWTVEVALPWEGLKWLADDDAGSLARGDLWRIGLARREIIDQRASRRLATWTWHPLGEHDIHVPESYMTVELA
jgi:hypothetical protein